MNPPLYNRDILALAVALAEFPRLAAPCRTAELRAPLCGSRLTLDLAFDSQSRVCAVGIAAEACALGQASATLLARSVLGKTSADLAALHASMSGWIEGQREAAPDWPGIEALAAARAYPARHAAIMLPFALAAQLSTAAVKDAAAC